MKYNKTVLITVAIVAVACLSILCFFLGTSKGTRVAVDFSLSVENAVEESKYDFLGSSLSSYICSLSSELGLDSDLVVAILMVENPEFNPDATNKNENGTIDVGLFQLNDKYLWTDFKNDYWFDNIELNPFNWKHNTYIALHHIAFLQNKMKVQDDVIMAYNGGYGAVMNGEIKPNTKVYLAKVKNNLFLLKGGAL